MWIIQTERFNRIIISMISLKTKHQYVFFFWFIQANKVHSSSYPSIDSYAALHSCSRLTATNGTMCAVSCCFVRAENVFNMFVTYLCTSTLISVSENVSIVCYALHISMESTMAGRHCVCLLWRSLRNDIPMKQHYKRSKDPCLSVLYRFIHSCVSNRKQKVPFHLVLHLVIHKLYFLSAPKLEIGLEDDTEIKMAY